VVSPEAPVESNIVASSVGETDTPEGLFDVFLPHDASNSANVNALMSLIDLMKDKSTQEASFTRMDENGAEEAGWFVRSPVLVRELKPVQPDDFSRGVNSSDFLLYHLTIARQESELYAKFDTINDEIENNLSRMVTIYLVLTCVITAACIMIMAGISVGVTKPQIQLLQVVKRVNEGRIEDDMQPLTGGSREVHQVYASFAKLYKILRMSYSAFFYGDLDWAHHILSDALQLFRKIGDEKAVAIANNNMGNTLLALTVDRRSHGTCICLDDGKCCVKTALECYEKAVSAGTKDFESVDSDAEKALFAQQVADRHFNRAICLLHVSDDPCAPDNAKEQALTDLVLAKQYDQGVKEYMLYSRTLFKNSDIIFERTLRRLYGLAQLASIDSRVWEVWDIYDLIDQGDLMLQAAWNQVNAPIFREVTNVGRLQELEGAAASVELSAGNYKDAAVLSTRMLVEDEYLMSQAWKTAADCLLKYARESGRWSSASIAMLRQEFRKMRSGKKTSVDIGRCYVYCIDLSDQWNGTKVLQSIQDECLAFYNEHCGITDSFGLVTLDAHQDGVVYTMKPGVREEYEVAHREAIRTATTKVVCSQDAPVLPRAIDMALETASSMASDVYLVYVSDGRAFTQNTFAPLVEAIRDAKRSSIDLITVGVHVESDDFEESCKNLCLATRSRNSMYFSADTNSVDCAFRSARSCVKRNDRVQQGLTMEKF